MPADTPPAPAPQAPVAAPAAKVESPEALARKEVTRNLKGPVAAVFKSLVPPLANQADPYKAIMENSEFLAACFKLFRAKREAFAEFLVDAEGKPVADDAARLKCGRSVDEVIGMAVRSGMRAYAEAHFGDPIDPAKVKTVKIPAKKAPPAKGFLRLLNLASITELFRRNHGVDRPPPKGQSRSGRFYASIKDVLDFEWQVKFFPIYVEIPAHVFEKLGTGITRLDSEEKLLRLGQLAVADIQKAEAIIKDPELAKEMLDNNVLASTAVLAMGQANFDALHGALGGLDAKKKWDVFANKDMALKLQTDKRINKADIEALADYLDVLNELALDAMLDLKLNRDQMQLFLKTAEEHLGRPVFLALFGPIQTMIPDDPEEQARIRKYQTFTQNALRNLVQAVKQLEEQLRRGGGGGMEECLSTVCLARRPELEREIKKLAPPMG